MQAPDDSLAHWRSDHRVDPKDPPGAAPPLIRTPDQTLRVFVSSTLKELADERAAAQRAIRALHLTPVLFESGARPYPARSLYRAYLAQSHIFIGIYWQRYGWIAPGEEISGLEDEYRLAAGLPKLIYIKAPAPEREPRLEALLEQIKQEDGVSYQYFSTARELQRFVTRDLALMLSEHFELAQGKSLENGQETPFFNVPAQYHPLVDRQEDLGILQDWLLDPGVRLVTLTGPGGIGKSKLSLELGVRVRGHFRDGVCFVGLEALSDPDLLVPALTRALGLRADQEQTLLEGLKAFLTPRQMLLILDNFEQLMPAAGVLSTLIGNVPELKVLVTSRVILRLRGEHAYTLPPLETPRPAEDLMPGTLAAYPAVKLFVQRAAEMKSDFSLTSENANAVVQICTHLEGLPLALELAAAKLKVLSPQALLSRLEDRQFVLAGGVRDLPPRQRTLRATLEWSHALLDEPSQILFRRLAVFRGQSTLASIEAVCNKDRRLDGQTLEALETLLNSSLLRRLEPVPASTPFDQDEGCFGMLRIIREYAWELLEASGEAGELQQQLAWYCLEQVEAAELHLASGRRGAWLDRLEVEYPNLQATLEWSQNSLNEGEVGLRLAGALTWFWYFRHRLREGRDWLDRVLAQPVSSPTVPLRAKAELGAGSLAWFLSDYEAARRHLEACAGLCRDMGEGRLLAYALNYLGVLAVWTQGGPAARAMHAESLALVQRLDDRWGQVMALFFEGVTELILGECLAQSPLAQCLALARELDDRWSQALALQALGSQAIQLGDYTGARGLIGEAIAIVQESGDDWMLGTMLIQAGTAARGSGDLDQAQELVNQSLVIVRRIGNRHGISWALRSLAALTLERKDLEAARAQFQESLRLSREIGERAGMASCLEGLACVAVSLGQHRRAAKLLGAAPTLFRTVGLFFNPQDRLMVEQIAAQARQALGEQGWLEGLAEGEALLGAAGPLDLDRIRDFALEAGPGMLERNLP